MIDRVLQILSDPGSDRVINFSDIALEPRMTSIESRSECNPYIKDNLLPIMVAPMDAVIDDANYDYFSERCITWLPRTVSHEIRKHRLVKCDWVSLSLKEFKEMTDLLSASNDVVSIYDLPINKNPLHILIDTANGQLMSIYNAIQMFYDKWMSLTETLSDYPLPEIYVGNIATPDVYRYICENYDLCKIIKGVRVCVGTGSACTTKKSTGAFYNPPKLIRACKEIKNKYENYDCHPPLIIADGGFYDYCDICLALALGADIVMMGRRFCEVQEACGPILHDIICEDGRVYKNARAYRGMSTKGAQVAMYNANKEENKSEYELENEGRLKPAEGRSFYVGINCTLDEFINELDAHIRSSMSYMDSRTLDEYRENARFQLA